MGFYPSSMLFTFHYLAFVSHDSFPYLSTGSHVTMNLLTPLPPLHLLLSGHVVLQLISISKWYCVLSGHWHCYSKRASVSTVDQGRSYQICSDIPSCVCIQPFEDFLRGSRDCSFGFPKQDTPTFSLFSSLFLSLDQAPIKIAAGSPHHWHLGLPYNFHWQLPTFNTQKVCYNLESVIYFIFSKFYFIHSQHLCHSPMASIPFSPVFKNSYKNTKK